MDTKKMDAMLQQIVEQYQVPALVVGVVESDEIVYTGSFGVTNLETQEPVTTKSLFHMASISKPFVATALVQLAEQGHVELDAPVVTYLPYFKIDDERSDQLTLRQMLTHTAGMPDVEDYAWDSPEYDEDAVERFVRGLTKEKLIHAPGEKFRYSNMAYEVLGDVISKVAGRPFEDYVNDHILIPLGMVESTFLKKNVSPALETSPHLTVLNTFVSDVYPYNRRHAASSTLHSNVLEMCHWIRANLNRGEFNGQRILKQASYDELWQAYAPTNPESPTQQVGLSWFMWEHQGHKAIGHSGGDVGFSSDLAFLPDKGIGVVAMVNAIPSPVYQVPGMVLDVMLGAEPTLPKPSATLAVGAKLKAEGIDAAVTQFRHLQQTQPDSYKYDAADLFEPAYAAMWTKAYEDVLKIVHFIQTVHPDTADQVQTYELLGEAYFKMDNPDQATQNLQKALELNPDSRQARELLQQLSE